MAAPASSPLRSLYVCYLSLDDPLVESQVVAYLEGLAERGHTLHLLTFEPGRLTRARRAGYRERMHARGVHWHGLRYHKRPSLAATTVDAICGALACAWLVRRNNLDAVHARSHVPAAMSMLAAPLSPHRLIFDLRGLLAEEYVDLGRWRTGGLAFRITKRAERAAMCRAEGIVVLTERVRRLLFGAYQRDHAFVIPCCADVERAVSQSVSRDVTRRALGIGDRPVLAYVGKLGGWYMDAEMVEFFAAARAVIPGLFLLLITQSDGDTIELELGRRRIARSDYAITAVEHARLGELLAAADASVVLGRPTPSSVARSPTKIGEALASGLPVVATDIGDVGPLLESTRTGVILNEFSASAYRAGARELASMLAEPETLGRCVATARQHLSLRDIGIPRYDSLYRAVAPVRESCPGCGARAGRPRPRFRAVGLVRCPNCGLSYTEARPSDDALAAWYARYPVLEQIPAATSLRLEELVRTFEPYRQLGTLLDVGAGSGHLLIAAARAGWTSHALEIGARQRERLASLGFPLHSRVSCLGDRSFDVVVLQEVIEHLRDPARELREVARVLRPGGLLYLSTPNFSSLSGRLLGPRWRVVEHPEHLNYFTRSALRHLTARSGLNEVDVETTGLSLTGIRAAVRPQRSGSGPSFDERFRAATVRSPWVDAVRRRANAVLVALELGDTIKGRYERRGPP